MKNLTLLAVLFCAHLHAATFYVDRTSGDASASIAAAVNSLVRTSVGELGHSAVSSPEKADYILKPSILTLGASSIVTLEKEKGGKTIFTAKLKSKQPEELDDITKRLTRSVISEKHPAGDLRVDEVSEDEATRGTLRRPALKGSHFSLGPAVFSGLNTDGIGYYFAAGYAWDVNKAFLRITGEFAGQGDALTGNLGIGVNYFLSDEDLAPFVGADLGFGVWDPLESTCRHASLSIL